MYHDKHSAGFVLHHPPRHAKPSGHSAMMRAACAFLAAACLVLSVTVYPASAATSMSSLQNKLDKISASIKQHKTELNDAKKKEAAAKALESELKEKVSVLQSQIGVLKSQISEVQNSIGVKEQEITAKQNELNNSVKEARLSAAEAQQAQKNAQAAIESDEMNYEAVKKEIQKLIAAAAASKPQLSFSGFICPLKSYTRISSEYGWRKNPVSGVNKLHAGIDFAAPAGTPIYAAASGYVQVAGWSSGGYGNYVVIYHGKMTDGNAYSTLYGHMRSVATSAGKYVNQGDLIGYVGSTGNSTGNHLHLEVWKGGSKANAVNPRGYIPIR